ncbi:MAG: hypothetical protein ACTSRZ_12685 [Promethearchaeota archaeon]
MDLLAKYPRCPHCNKKIGFFNRIEYCSYSGELVCNKCIVSGRFSDSVVEKIPSEFREKFRVFNILLWAIVVFIGLLFIQSAWYRFGGWSLYNTNALMDNILYILKMSFIGLIILMISIRLPHLGTWMFYWWASKPDNKKKLENAVKAMEEGRYESTNKLYNFKIGIFNYLKQTNAKIIHIAAMSLSIIMIPLFFIMKYTPNLSGTLFSSFVGVVWVLTIIMDFALLSIAAGYYCHKSAENHKIRLKIEIFEWLYILLLPVIYFTFILGQLYKLNAFEELLEELAGKDFSFMIPLYQSAFVVQRLLIVLLALFLIKKGNPIWEIQQYKKIRQRMDIKKLLYEITKRFITLIFVIILIGLMGLCIFELLVDPTMAFGIISPTYLQFGIFIPVIFVVLKLVPRRPRKYTQLYWTCMKISLIIIGIASTPAILTPIWTNNYIEDQFAASFGSDWQSKIPTSLKAKFRQTPYSAFENFFGFDISYDGAALFDVKYMEDSPRYVYKVENGTRVIISNGSSKYTEIKREFTFDIYLPPGEEFGVGTNKYPTIIFCHGIGMSKGTGNANFSISRYFANQGYTVVDMEYGRTGWVENSSTPGNKGYDFPDTIRQVANATHFLYNNRDFYHVDLNNVWFAGRSFGGWMATVLSYGYNLTFFGSNFTSHMTVRGCIPFYGAVGIADAGKLMTLDFLGPEGLDLLDTTAPYIRGSPDPDDPDYNPEWIFYNPYKMIDPSINGGNKVCPTLMIHGTQDPLVPPGWDIRLKGELEKHGNIGIAALYPLGSHATDVIHWSHYGQSVLYYMERFLALTRADL